jgi:hypothetical protein
MRAAIDLNQQIAQRIVAIMQVARQLGGDDELEVAADFRIRLIQQQVSGKRQAGDLDRPLRDTGSDGRLAGG